jgi:hypothetical protein
MRYFLDNIRASLLSITGAVTGTAIGEIEPVTNYALNTFFEHTAWTVGILAGIFSIIKTIRDLRQKK